MPPTQQSRRRSCATCVRAKAKCQATGEKGICNRCARLGQHCSRPSAPEPDRDRIAPQNKDKLDFIQDQLDTLLARLSEKPAPPTYSPRNLNNIHNLPQFSGADADIIARGIVNLSDAEKSLQKFRVRKMPLFPFVIVRPNETLNSLRQQSPFLLLTILAACQEDNPELQRVLDAEVRNVVASRIILNNERTMDLLLGLLVHIAWHHYYWESLHPQQCMFLSVASGMIADLGLDGQTSYTMPAGYSTTSRLDITLLPVAYQRSAAGKRALLGWYYLCSTMSIFRRNFATSPTRQINEYCASLLANPEHPTDPLLRVFIDGHSLSGIAGEKSTESDPLGWDDLSRNIDEACARMKGDLTRHGLFINGATLLCFRAMHAFAGISYLRYLKKGFGAGDFRSVQVILISARSTITTFLELPSSVAVDLPITSLITVWYCLLIICKLTVLAPLASRNTWIDRDELGRSRARQLSLAVVDRFGSLSCGSDFWQLTTRVFCGLIPWLDEKLDASNTDTGSVTFPTPIDGSRASGPMPAAGSATEGMNRSRRPGDRGLAAENIEYHTTLPDASICQSAPSTLGLETGMDDLEKDSFCWDEATWQQMMADFALCPSAFST